MSTGGFRLVRKQTSSVGSTHRFRVAVFGQAGVGKTAFIVRFITKRFIGEYDPTLESIYQRAFVVPPNHPVFFEIMDTPGQEENTDILKEKIKWADAFIILYSITDRVSFSEINRLKFLISHTTSNGSQKSNLEPPIMIIGNKNDLEIERMVSTDEGARLATSINCYFYEVSVRESVDEVTKIFEDLYKTYRQINKCMSGKPKIGSSGHFELPVMSHHFHALPTKRKHKSFKHVDRMPRMQGSTNATRSAINLYNDISPTIGESITTDAESASTTKCNVDGHRHQVMQPLESKKPPEVAEASTSDTADEDDASSIYDNSSSYESNLEEEVEDEYRNGENYAKKAAEAFIKKVVLLNLE